MGDGELGGRREWRWVVMGPRCIMNMAHGVPRMDLPGPGIRLALVGLRQMVRVWHGVLGMGIPAWHADELDWIRMQNTYWATGCWRW